MQIELQKVIALTDDKDYPWGVYEWKPQGYTDNGGKEWGWDLIECFLTVEEAISFFLV